MPFELWDPRAKPPKTTPDVKYDRSAAVISAETLKKFGIDPDGWIRVYFDPDTLAIGLVTCREQAKGAVKLKPRGRSLELKSIGLMRLFEKYKIPAELISPGTAELLETTNEQRIGVPEPPVCYFTVVVDTPSAVEVAPKRGRKSKAQLAAEAAPYNVGNG